MKNSKQLSQVTSGIGLLFLSALFFVLILIGAELTYRRYVENKPREFDLGHLVTQDIHVAKPYVMFTSRPGYQQYGEPGFIPGQINALGYLGALPTKLKPKSEYRIFLLGGSAAFFGTPPFSISLEKLFQTNGHPEVKVFNFSVIAGVSRQELIRILTDIAGYEPDLIISYTGYNDMYDTGWDPRINYPHRYILSEANPVTARSAADYKLLPTLALSSQYLRDHYPNFIFDQLTKGIYPNYMPQRQTIRPLIAKAFIQNLRLSNNLSEQLGSKYMAFFQPTVFFKKNLTESETNLFKPQDLKIAEEALTAVQNEVRPFLKEFNFIDASNLFSDQPRTAFVDYVHYVDEPWLKEAIAKYVYENILKTVDLNKRSMAKIQNLAPEEIFTFNPPAEVQK